MTCCNLLTAREIVTYLSWQIVCNFTGGTINPLQHCGFFYINNYPVQLPRGIFLSHTFVRERAKN
jgi:hypothetical protein